MREKPLFCYVWFLLICQFKPEFGPNGRVNEHTSEFCGFGFGFPTQTDLTGIIFVYIFLIKETPMENNNNNFFIHTDHISTCRPQCIAHCHHIILLLLLLMHLINIICDGILNYQHQCRPILMPFIAHTHTALVFLLTLLFVVSLHRCAYCISQGRWYGCQSIKYEYVTPEMVRVTARKLKMCSYSNNYNNNKNISKQ